MSNSNELSTKSAQSLQVDVEEMIATYGEGYGYFLQKYPTLRNIVVPINSIRDAVEKGGKSLVEIDNYFGANWSVSATTNWIKIMLIDTLMVMGAFESATVYQINVVAQNIRQEYYHLTPYELTRFFYEFSLGEYEDMYVGRTINPQCIFKSLKRYVCKLYEQRAMVDSEKLAEKQKQEAIEAKKNAISWEEYCKRKGRDKTSNPLGGLQEKVKQESKRADNGERK